MPRAQNAEEIGGYQGEVVRIPLGREGLTYSKNPSSLPPYGLLQADTITYAEDSVRKAPGKALFGRYAGPAVGESVVSLFDWSPTEGEQHTMSFASDGVLYRAPATSVILDTFSYVFAVPTAKPPLFVEAGGELVGKERLLVVFNESFSPVFLRGVTAVGTPLLPTDWSAVTGKPVFGVVHNNRLFGFGNANAPHSIYGSTIDDHSDFRTGVETGTPTPSSATYHRVHPGKGLRLYSGYSHKGMLFLLKYPKGVFYLDDTDINPQGWKVNCVSDAMGVPPTPFAGVLIDDGILFMSSNAQFFLITATTQGGVTITDLSTRMLLDQWIQNNVNVSRLGNVVSAWDPTLKQAVFAVSSVREGTASLTNDLLLTFDFRAFTRGEAKVRFAYSYRDAAQALATRRNPSTLVYEIALGSYEIPGRAYLLDQEDRSINTADPGATPVLTGYQAVFQTNHTDLSEYYPESQKIGPMNKIWDWIGIEYVPNTGGDVTVTQLVDGAAQPVQTATLTQSGPRLAPAPGFTEFTIYSGVGSTVASELAGPTTSGLDLRIKWIRALGTGRRISIQVASSAVASEDMHITAIYLGFRRAGQDVGRGQGAS